MTVHADLFAELQSPLWLADRIGLERRQLYSDIVHGTTDAPTRAGRMKQILRDAIARNRCADRPCGKNSKTGETETYRQAFERLYAEKL